jgi:subtilase family serine protease
MKTGRRARARCATAIAIVLSTSLVALGPAGSASGAQVQARPTLHRACGVRPTGQVRCFAEWRAGGSRLASTPTSAAIGLPSSGYGPTDVASAYQLDTKRGSGQTVAIVDAFDNPRVESDLTAYRRAWGLPPCGSSTGCFRKVNQRGGSTPPFADPGWGVEIALDVQAVSAACPRCKILLVEADTPSFVDIGKSVNTAVRLGADIVSNSYGGDEFNGVLNLAATYYTHPGVAQVASSGDFGFGPAQFPAAWSKVIAAGGTSLTRTSTGGWRETAWSGSGSGCSAWIDKPTWQHDDHCPMRTVADVSAVADPDTGFAVYDTFGLGSDNGWIVVGGTSVSSPLIAGMIGLAGNAGPLDKARYIYWHRSGLHDVIGGSNGYCGGDYLCNAKVGYDAPTGLGSPRGVSAL